MRFHPRVTAPESLPTDLAAAHAMILAERAARQQAEALAAKAQAEAATAKAEAANAQADLSSTEALINHLKLEIEKLRRALYGTRSEHKARLLEQMELQLEELEATAAEDELTAEKAAAQTQIIKSFQRKRPSRKPFSDHVPRERVVIPAPVSCPCCGSKKLSKLGEDITETLEVVPRQWKVIQTVREKFSCRNCETIAQPPAPFHVTPRGFAGPNLLAMILFEKFGQHQPLNRQSERYRREGIDLSLSTLADQVGACTSVLQPLYALIERHELAAERLHGNDTTVPILAKGKTVKGHIWTYVRDDRPFGGRAPPAALYYASRDRRQEHPARHLCGFTGILQADAYSATTSSTSPRGRRDQSSPHCVGRTLAGISSSWRTSRPMPGAARRRQRSRRSRWRRSNVSTPCSTSNAASMAKVPKSGCGCATNRVRLCWWRWRHGCANSGPASRTHPRSPSRSTICCAAGTGLPTSSMMAGSASPIMPPNAPCAALPWDASHGSSPAPNAPRSW
jgi:transposase